MWFLVTITRVKPNLSSQFQLGSGSGPALLFSVHRTPCFGDRSEQPEPTLLPPGCRPRSDSLPLGISRSRRDFRAMFPSGSGLKAGCIIKSCGFYGLGRSPYLGKVILHLKLQPTLGAATKRLGQPDGHFGGNTGVTVQ